MSSCRQANVILLMFMIATTTFITTAFRPMAGSTVSRLSELHLNTGTDYLYYSPSFQRHVALRSMNDTAQVLQSFLFLDDAKASYPNATLLPISEQYENNSLNTLKPRMSGGGLEEDTAYCPTSQLATAAVAKTCFSSGETLFKYKLVVSKLYERIISKIVDTNSNTTSVELAFLERFPSCDRHFVRERMLFFLSPLPPDGTDSKNIPDQDWPKLFSLGFGAGLTEKQAFGAIQALPHLLAIDPIESKRRRPPLPFFYQMGVPPNLVDQARTKLDDYLTGVGIDDIASIAYLKSLDIHWAQCEILLRAFPCLLIPSNEPSWEHSDAGKVRSVFMGDALFYLRSRLQLTPAELFAMLKTHSRLSMYTVHHLKIHLDALQSKLHLTSKEAQRLVLRTPSLLGVSLSNLDERICFLRSDINMTLPQIKEAVLELPALLQYSVRANMRPKVSYMRKHLGISQGNLTKIVTSEPLILGRSLNRTIIPLAKGLEETCGVSRHRIGAILVQVPKLFRLSWDTNLKPKIIFFKERLGLSDKQLKQVLVSTPRILVHSIDGSLEPKLNLLEESEKRDIVSKIIVSNPSILLVNKGRLKEKLSLLSRNNVTIDKGLAPKSTISGPIFRRKKPVIQYSTDGTLIQTFPNVSMAADAAGTSVAYMYNILRNSRTSKGKRYAYGSIDELSTASVDLDEVTNPAPEIPQDSPRETMANDERGTNNGYSKDTRRNNIPQDGNFRLADALHMNSTAEQNKGYLAVFASGRSYPPDKKNLVRGRRRAGGLALHFPQAEGFNTARALQAAAESLLGGQVMPERKDGTTYLDGMVLIGYPYLRPSRNRCSLYACFHSLRLVQNLLIMQRSSCPEFENATFIIDIFTDSTYAWKLVRNTTRLLQWGSYENKEDFNYDGEGPAYAANTDILYPMSRAFYRMVEQELLPIKGTENPTPRIAKEVNVRFRHISEAREDVRKSPLRAKTKKIGDFAARAAEWQYERARQPF